MADCLQSYTEVSVSGKGLHVFVVGQLPAALKLDPIEMYDRGRFIAVTGNRLDLFPSTVEDRHVELNELYRRFRPEPTAPVSTPPFTAPISLDDAELLRRAERAGDGMKFPRLWSGNWSGYPSQSEADMALISMLTFWCGPDTGRITSLFLASGLGDRPKARRPDYLPRTIKKVLATKSVYYSGQHRNSTRQRPSMGHSINTVGGLVLGRSPVVANWPDLLQRARSGADGPLQVLAGVCRELQARHGDSAFFLSCREAGEHLGIGRTTASRYLKKLQSQGWLELVKLGDRSTGSASEYRWRGSQG